MTGLIAQAEALVAAINDAPEGVKAFTDPAEAVGNRPCLLIAPPTLDYTAGTMTGPLVRWRLIALSAYPAGTFAALAELEKVVDAAETVLDVDRAEPIQYPFGQGRVAAYLITTTDYAS